MSADTSASLVVGLPFKEVCNDMDEYEALSNNPEYLQSAELEIISPYYDAYLKDCLVGFTLASSGAYNYKEISENFAITKNKELFETVTGKKAKFYLTPYIIERN